MHRARTGESHNSEDFQPTFMDSGICPEGNTLGVRLNDKLGFIAS
jgi:hypothetical protein